MGFFSELKDDLSQAVNTILPNEEDANDPLLAAARAEEPVVEPVLTAEDPVPDPAAEVGVVIDAESSGDRTIEEVFQEAMELEAETGSASSQEKAAADIMEGVDLDSMLSRIDEMETSFVTEEELSAPSDETPEPAVESEAQPDAEQDDQTPPWRNLPDEEVPAEQEESPAAEAEPLPEPDTSVSEDVFGEAIAAAMSPLPDEAALQDEQVQETAGADDAFVENALSAAAAADPPRRKSATVKESKKQEGKKMDQAQQLSTPTDENAVITAGMRIDGDVTTSGSLDVIGKINGNVTANGKLNVTGALDGNLTAAEIYAENARITGEVRSSGAAKIGQSTVIIGNIYANSAVIAGAVKGDIDVHGPVVLDTTAIVMGNIKSQSVQINNGAVVEGMCSQAYAEVNPQAFFDGLDA